MDSASAIRLIEEVKRRPALYDRTHEQYSNRSYIQQQWNDIADDLGMDPTDAKRKWTYHRDYFQRQSRIGLTDKYKNGEKRKIWYHYKRMLFLLPHTRHSSAKDEEFFQEEEDEENNTNQSQISDPGLKCENDDNCELSEDDRLEESSPRQGRRGNKRWKRMKPYDSSHSSSLSDGEPSSSWDVQMQLLQLMETMSHRLCNPVESLETDDEHFFKSLLPMFQQLDPVSKLQCRIDINSVVMSYMNKCNSGGGPQTEELNGTMEQAQN